eukprot:TRINITY_DN467_c2_g2_i2.p1 TRINITY_DN467_c2_g2~~TRINITY_DN467_c2_g2_i2.p1  ORF type:complete len:493 (+),score=101.34 TRINITY_DN467_c2_g2_i2:34-1479(+)
MPSEGYEGYSAEGNYFEVPIRYDVKSSLGSGAFGVVCMGFDKVREKDIAIKKICSPFKNLEEARKLVRELRLLKHFRHENTIGLLDILIPATADYQDIYIATDLLDIDMRQMFLKQTLGPEHVQYFMTQLLAGVDAIHSAGVLHRDLKPENIFLNTECELKIGDFGLARDSQHTMKSEYVVTRWYRAPELLMGWGSNTSKGAQYGTPIDMWSVGCIFAEMLASNHAPIFPGGHYLQQLQWVLRVLGTPEEDDIAAISGIKAQEYIRNNRFESVDFMEYRRPNDTEKYFPENVDPQAIDMLKKLLVFNPDKRATALGLRNHPYLGEYTLDAYYPDEVRMARFDSRFEEHIHSIEDARKICNTMIVEYNPEFRNKEGVFLHELVSGNTADDSGVWCGEGNEVSGEIQETIELLQYATTPGIEPAKLQSLLEAAVKTSDGEVIRQTVNKMFPNGILNVDSAQLISFGEELSEALDKMDTNEDHP